MTQKAKTSRVTVEFLRQKYPQLRDASDMEIAALAYEAFAPEVPFSVFEREFLGEPQVMRELGRGIARGGRYAKAGWDFLAGGLASLAGDEASADRSFQSFEQNTGAARRIAARRSFLGSESARDYAAWAAGLVGEGLPMLAAGVAGPAALGAVSTTSAIGPGVDRVEYLMPDASTGKKAVALGSILGINGMGDAFIPARLLSGAGGRGVKAAAKTVGQGMLIGGATPVAERAAAQGAVWWGPDELWGDD